MRLSLKSTHTKATTHPFERRCRGTSTWCCLETSPSCWHPCHRSAGLSPLLNGNTKSMEPRFAQSVYSIMGDTPSVPPTTSKVGNCRAELRSFQMFSVASVLGSRPHKRMDDEDMGESILAPTTGFMLPAVEDVSRGSARAVATCGGLRNVGREGVLTVSGVLCVHCPRAALVHWLCCLSQIL